MIHVWDAFVGLLLFVAKLSAALSVMITVVTMELVAFAHDVVGAMPITTTSRLRTFMIYLTLKVRIAWHLTFLQMTIA